MRARPAQRKELPATTCQTCCIAAALSLIMLANCTAAPTESPSAPKPSISPTSQPTINSAPAYDASNLAAKFPALINVPEAESCKNQGIAFIRGKFNNQVVNRCSNVKVESGWCDFTAITAKFNALGTIKMENPAAGIAKTDPATFFNALQSAGWLPDQCGTMETRTGTREPVVYLYKEPQGDSGTLGVMPVCLIDAQVTFKNAQLCEL